MKKILFVITRSNAVGGAQIYVLNLAKCFQEEGYEVAIAAQGCGVFSEVVKENDLKYFDNQTLY